MSMGYLCYNEKSYDLTFMAELPLTLVSRRSCTLQTFGKSNFDQSLSIIDWNSRNEPQNYYQSFC